MAELLNQKLLVKINLVIKGMTAAGMPMKITDGYRTAKQQNALYKIGRTKPGKIITNADGYIKLSNHQSGNAVDCCFLINGKPNWDDVPDSWWTAYGALCIAVGLKWGIKINGWIDRTHTE